MTLLFIFDLLKKNAPPELENWCSEIQYFDQANRSVAHYYGPVVLLESSIRTFPLPSGTMVRSADILEDSVINTDLCAYPILKDGSRYKVKLLINEKCGKFR